LETGPEGECVWVCWQGHPEWEKKKPVEGQHAAPVLQDELYWDSP